MNENVTSQKRGGVLAKVILIYLAVTLLFSALSFLFMRFDLSNWGKDGFQFAEQHNQPDREAFKNRWIPLYLEKGPEGFALEEFSESIAGSTGEMSATAIAAKCEEILNMKETIRADNIRQNAQRPKIKIKTDDELLNEALKKVIPTNTYLPVFPMLYYCLFQLIIGVACVIFMKMSSASYNVGLSLTPKSNRSLIYTIPLMIFFVLYTFIKLTWAQSFVWSVVMVLATVFADLMIAALGMYLLRAVGARRAWKIVVPTISIVLAHLLSYVLMMISNVGGYGMTGLVGTALFMPFIIMVGVVIPVVTLFGVVAYYKSHQLVFVYMMVSLVVISLMSMLAWTKYLLPAASYVTYGLFIVGLPLCLIAAIVLLINILATKKPIRGDELSNYAPLER